MNHLFVMIPMLLISSVMFLITAAFCVVWVREEVRKAKEESISIINLNTDVIDFIDDLQRDINLGDFDE
tara:strand:- start:1614 stop:1820 length:207 start_codon:yes stop_codon:yes gene_type:complete